MIKEIFNIEELAIKSVLFILFLLTQNDNVLLIFPSEFFSEVYLAYCLLGSLLFTGFTFWWAFDSTEKTVEVSIKRQIYKVLLRTFLGTFMGFIILGLIKANVPKIEQNTLLTIGILLGFGFEYYAKKSFINSIFKNIAQKLLDVLNKNNDLKQ